MKLTETRKWILMLYAICVFIVCIYVPWKETIVEHYSEDRKSHNVFSCEYGFIWEPRKDGYYHYDRKYKEPSSTEYFLYRRTGVDFERIQIEVFTLSIIFAIAFILDDSIKAFYEKIRR